MSYLFIIRTFRLLVKHKPWKLLFLFLLNLFQGLNTGFSIVLLIPLLQLLNVGNGGLPGGFVDFFRRVSETTGVALTVESVLIIYVILLSLNALVQYWKSILDAGYQATLIHDARLRMFRKIILADWPLLNSKSKTNHIQILTKEIPVLANYYYYLLKLIASIIILTAFIAYAVIISAKFTLIIIVTGLFLFYLLRRYLLKSYHFGEESIDKYNRLFKYIDDFWESVKIAKVHSSEEFYYRKFDEANKSLLDIETGTQKNYNMPQLIYRVTGIIVLVIVIYTGYRTGDIPLASFFILILLFAKIFPHFIGINTDMSMIFTYLPSVKAVYTLDDEFPDKEFSTYVTFKPLCLDKEILLNNISFSYPEGEPLFKDFSTKIPANRITGIIGLSGIGKTTLIDLIAGLQKPSSGKILIDGQLLDEQMIPSWKSSLGYLPQDPFFIDGTIRENLVWDSNPDISDTEIIDVLKSVNAVHLINRFDDGIDSYIMNYFTSFSGGECQRLALARVLLRKPGLILLDEATSSLDAENEAIIMDVISKLSKNVTVIFVTHRRNLLPFFHNVIRL